jgi:hypothetical protein
MNALSGMLLPMLHSSDLEKRLSSSYPSLGPSGARKCAQGVALT